ncbi:MAG: ribulose-phosphate 3-epimerase [archaeon]|nr:ribulose-phosphate 3-epimerase [archaeon]
MIKVSPSMLSADFSRLGDEVLRVVRAGADCIHLDVMDGLFVPSITIGPPVIASIRRCTDIPFDVHLMIENPIEYIDDFVKAGADYLTVHCESKSDIDDTIDRIHTLGKRAGIALNPETPVRKIVQYLDTVELVLVMTVHPGFGGQLFIEENLEKIRYLKGYAEKYGLEYEISVDGGINRGTGIKCVESGATVLVSGNYLFQTADLGREIEIWHLL